MPAVLVDTSAWIRLRTFAGLEDLVPLVDVRICGPIVQELLQGTGDDRRYARVREALRFPVLLDDPMPLARYEQAAALYLRCRRDGITVRSSVDCLIAVVAIVHGCELLHDDRDFDHIASVSTLKARRL